MNIEKKHIYLMASYLQEGPSFERIQSLTGPSIEISKRLVCQLFPPKTVEEFYELLQKALSSLELKNIRWLSPLCELYPLTFSRLERPPLCVYVKGDIHLLEAQFLGVVGSRKLRDNVENWSEIHLSSFLEKYKTPLVSGAAGGVDQLGHRLAMAKQVPTLAILPSGFDKLYPRSFRSIAEDICERGGCLLTEYPPSFEVRNYSFHQRNRLIAAISSLLLVLQAERRSGSMITANQARFSDTELACLPGDPTDPLFFGTNDLIADGASILRDRDDLVSLYFSCFKNTSSIPDLFKPVSSEA